MKTMMELLIRLQEMRDCCERATHNPQLTGGEREAAYCFESLVRGCLPNEVLGHYDRMTNTEPALLKCPEIFAMAVLVSTYQSLSPRKRRRLATHFATPLRVRSGGPCSTRVARRGQRLLHPPRLRLAPAAHDPPGHA